MTNKEFSDGFSTLLNSFGITPNITLDEYEKSTFLTNAQEQLIIDIYSGRNIIYGKSFEQTEEIRRYLSNLVETYETSTKVTGKLGLSKDSVFFEIPQDTWFITYEVAFLKDSRLGCLDGIEASVVPLPQDDLYRAKDNPFRGPSKDRVLRLDIKSDLAELISKYNVDKYLMRYISQPTPIILVDLPDGLSINGVSTESECELNPVVHRAILERAVQLAIISKTQLTGNKE
ncbi:hypothetical protein PhiCrAssBcn17_41 [Bacteroides phage PhiCrAssBcn17]|mgnify:FL=1|jgi:hypothetical protein|uniref:Ring protein 3 n=1 Tax=Bacteroides phage crAss001 TaxID=2301731 RepID=RING3_BPCA1|nr:hypothetical protein H3300_gp074 [Bacteroides phage crAss001]A0A385DV73.1 RecName: Full=Ring protein 3; Short=R3; AltName: Full=Gene product 35; Short=gp35 [Bacteroides phage crAss001]7QOJ_D Chain D, Ring protein 3 gp35 [Bacteroides phage crAss001]7QOL_D Chain D, Ring protein 3 gp35 [Bacteroides phage crAss001]7QOL_T Chain T, Ring protein 3 gp35 [Bacteroides phage crAss001]8CKB_L001 Chain L001, Ring protein 3 gp35 [Bacteroides phage crAss001]8CKB_L002 Chain L002, Ring protein 3 gp35 [Bacte